MPHLQRRLLRRLLENRAGSTIHFSWPQSTLLDSLNCLRTNVTCATGVLHEDFNECHCSRTWILEAVWRVRFEEMHLAGRNRFSLFFSFRSEKDLHSTRNRNKQMKRAFIVDMRRPH